MDIIEPVRQEILSGIAEEKQYKFLKTKLAAFEDMPISTGDYEKAAFFVIPVGQTVSRDPILIY